MKKNTAKKQPFIIVAFGDSMTACSSQEPSKRWPALLQARLNRAFPERRFEITNAGVGGNTSREGLARIARDVLAHSPDLTLVEFGGNDATTDPARSVSLAEFNRNLAAIAGHLRKTGSAAAWISFPPVIDLWHSSGRLRSVDAAEKFLPFGGLNWFLNLYRERTRRFALKQQDLFIDLYAALRDALEHDHPARFVLPDGVHFTDLGSTLAADIIFNALVRKTGARLKFRFR